MSREQYLEKYRDQRVLVLGASGFIGRWIARLLTGAPADLTLAVRNQEAADSVFRRFGVRGRIVVVDLRHPAAVAALLEAEQPAVVFNLAVYGVDHAERDSQDEASHWQLNRDLIAVVADELLRHKARGWTGARIVHAGTGLEYGTLDGDLAEDGPEPRPFNLYGRSKLAGTQALAERAIRAGAPTVTARLFQVYGPGEEPGRLLPQLIAGVSSGRTIRLTSGGRCKDFTYVEDVAEGLLRLGAASVSPGEVVNVATGKLLSIQDFVTAAGQVLPLKAEQLRYEEYGTHVAEMSHKPVAVALLQRLVGWTPLTPISEGIRRTIAFGA